MMDEEQVMKLNVPPGHVHKTACMKLNAYQLREDKDHLIVPAAITMEGVHNGSYKSAREIRAAVDMAKGRYVTFNHPDTMVVTRREHIVGHMENIRLRTVKRNYEGGVYELPQILADLYVCKKRTDKKKLDAIRNGEVTDVSIGYWCKDIVKKGNFLGEDYGTEERDILIDHTAILFGEKGACEHREDGTGCGLLSSNGAAISAADGNGDAGGASLAPTPAPPHAESGAAPNISHSHKTEQAEAETQEPGMSNMEDNVMADKNTNEGDNEPQDKKEPEQPPKQNTAPPTPPPKAEDDAAIAAAQARAAALQKQVEAYEAEKREAIVTNILQLKGIPKDNAEERAKYNDAPLTALQDRLSAMNDAVAAVNVTLVRGAGMAPHSNTRAETFGHKSGGTVGARVNGEWIRGFDHKEA